MLEGIEMPSWETLLVAGVLFVGTLVLSAGATIIVLARLPADYFAHDRRPPPETRRPRLRLLGRIGRNALAVALILGGLLLSLPGVPGQGLLTIFVGMLLLDYPGKYKLERWLVRRRTVRKILNRTRARLGRPPLRFTDDPPAA